MARIISIANQKGGVGKTTTATAVASCLKDKGNRVLIVDTDPQCNTTDTYRATTGDGIATIYDLFQSAMSGKASRELVEEVLQKPEAGDILPGDILLAAADSEFVNTGREHMLRISLAPVVDDYDYIIIDTPPATGVILANALTASNYIIVPMKPDRYSIQGLDQFLASIQGVLNFTNPYLKTLGLLLIEYQRNTNQSKQFVEIVPQIEKAVNAKAFITSIRSSVKIKEAVSERTPLFNGRKYRYTDVALDYERFTKEMVGRIEKMEAQNG